MSDGLNIPPVGTSAVGHSNVTLEMGITVIRADGTVEPLGVVSSSAWGRFSIQRLLAWFRIKRLNWRHQRRMNRREA